MPNRKLFAGALGLLLLAMIVHPSIAAAGCGCNKPPPKPAAVIPSVAAPGMPVTFYDRRFRKNQVWNVLFSSGTTSIATSARVVKKRDITDPSGKTITPQLVVVVPNLPPGPTSIKIYHGRRVEMMVPANSFVTMGDLVAVDQQNNELEIDNYATAVGDDGTLYVGVGGLNTVCDPMKFHSQLDGYPLRFGDGDVLIFNGQGYFIDALNPASHNHFFIKRGDPSASDQLIYERHSFQQYCIDHLPGGAKQVDPKDHNWHLDGTPHVDYSIVIFAVDGRFDSGAAQAPGPISSQMKMETEVSDGAGDWEAEPSQPED